MRVIGSGFGRTGTLSTKQALELLGFGPCYHMEEVFRRPAHSRAWADAAAGRPVDWTTVFAEFDSCVDYPASTVWEALLVAFPDAKVLHTVRSSDDWYDSTTSTIARSAERIPSWMPTLVPHLRRILDATDALVWQGIFDGRFDDRAHAIAAYDAWTAHVQATVPADRLLVFDVAQGWEPLCTFLGVDVPAKPFPRVNDRASMERRFRALEITGVAIPAAAAVLATAGAIGIARRR